MMLKELSYWASTQRTFSVREYGITVNTVLQREILERGWETLRINRYEGEDVEGLVLILTEGDINDIKIPKTYGIRISRKPLIQWLLRQGCSYGKWPARWVKLPDNREAIMVEITMDGIDEGW